MRRVNCNATLLTLVALLAALYWAAPAAAADPATQIRELTGAQTRIVWLRHKQWESYRGTVDAEPASGDGVGFSIMAFDTEGKGERELVPEGEHSNPLISPSGRHVIYSSRPRGAALNAREIHCVDWNGANNRRLGEGFALWPWRDPATGIEWVYAGNVAGANGEFVDRFQLDKPEARERLYTGRVSNRFTVSADGTRAAGEFPWPNAGMLYFRTGQVDRKNYRTGCNTYMSPDNSYFVTIMAGSHDLVTLYKPDGSSRDISVVPPGLKTVKDGGRGVMWNPKWASDARHLVVAGPFRNLGPDRADIWLGQFADDFNSIAKWVQVTDNDYMDVYAYVWVRPCDLGQFGGEAPYVVEVPTDRLGGEWEITYGDGTTGKATAIRHTYTKAGRFALVARQGQCELKGLVDVQPRKPPKVTGALLLDDTHVLVTFDEPVKSGRAAVIPKKPLPGLQVAYYVGGSLSSALYLDAMTPAKTGAVSVIDLAFAEKKEWFGLKFTGYIHVPKDGEYTFFTNSDDGSRLYIGNMEVVNNDGIHGTREVSGRIRLEAGQHPIRVYFMQGNGGATLSVSYEGPGIAKSQIPSQAFFRVEEPTAIDGAVVKLASGRAATRLYLDTQGRQLVAEFDQPLAAKETLVLEEVTDRAQVPNAVANPRLPVQRPSWPADTTGLVFLWKNAKAENQLWDPVSGGMRETGVSTAELRGAARFNRFGAAMAVGGALAPSPGSPERLMEGIKKTHQFSFEIVVASADLAQTKDTGGRPVSIFQWGNDWGEGLFWLLQEKNLLQVTVGGELRGSQKVFEMATLPDTKPHHLIVSYAPKRLAFYLDGKKVKEVDPSPASFIEVGTPPMRFAENGWRGQFEYLAFYNRFIEAPEAVKNAAAVAAELAQRKALPRIEVQATLVTKSKVPDPGQMAPYRNALIVNEYSVEKVLKGTYTGKTIRVAQWGMLDLKPTPLAAQAPGTSVKLVLETFADHDELVPELISDTLKEDFDLKLYTDVNL
jgi:hypothetical protein